MGLATRRAGRRSLSSTSEVGAPADVRGMVRYAWVTIVVLCDDNANAVSVAGKASRLTVLFA